MSFGIKECVGNIYPMGLRNVMLVADFLKETKYLDRTDGRKLCSDCSSIAILDPKECKPLIRNVHEFYISLNLKMDESLRVLLVDKIAMLKFNSPDEDDLLCMVWLSDRRPKRALVRISKCSKSEGSLGVERKPELPQKLTARQKSSGKIKALVIKFGMPYVHMGATMAHEMMQAWFYLNGVTELEMRVEEGICNLMRYMWMGWFCSTGADLLCKTSDEQVQYTRKLKDYIEHKMECDEDETYGQGFRDAMKAVSRFGLTTVLNHIVKERCLPSVHCES